MLIHATQPILYCLFISLVFGGSKSSYAHLEGTSVSGGTTINVVLQLDDIRTKIEEILIKSHKSGRKQITQKWYGGETFCVFGPRISTDDFQELSLLLRTINRAYGSKFRTIYQQDYEQCPSYTTFFVILSDGLDENYLTSVMKKLGGSRPPSPLVHSISHSLGFVVDIPGNRDRQLIYINPAIPPVNSNENPSKSIMIEEVFHAITGLADFDSKQVISVVGGHRHSPDYDNWFYKNPKGLCEPDLYILEMMIGDTLKQSSLSRSSDDWLVDKFNQMSAIIPTLLYKMQEYMDSRCIGYTDKQLIKAADS